MAMNALFFTDETMHKLYLSEIIIPFSTYLTNKRMEPEYIDKSSVSEHFDLPMLHTHTHTHTH